jgi:formate-dependent nitrite reductase cytochrome c552 subunit
MRKIHVRVAMVYIVIAIIFLIVRSFIVPPSFGEYGWYRGDSVSEIMNLSVKHAGSYSCSNCHQTEYKAWTTGKHSTVNCESCHGPLKYHVDDPGGSKVEVNATREFCGLCHNENPSRPEGFPQINLESHGNGFTCVTCHNPHYPWFD